VTPAPGLRILMFKEVWLASWLRRIVLRFIMKCDVPRMAFAGVCLSLISFVYGLY